MDERNRKDDPVEGSREVIDEELKKQGEHPPAEDGGEREAHPHPTEEELGPKGVP